MKKLAAVLFTSTAMAIAPLVVAPAAQAEICPGVSGRYVGPDGCIDVATTEHTVDPVESSNIPYVPGEQPCFTVEGVAYYTPPGDPC